MTGRLAIVGLGPGSPELTTPLASGTLAAATDLVGYGPYLARIPKRPGQQRHPSDNREELARAGKLDRAVYVERGTMPEERIVKLADKPDDQAAYFAVVLVPGERKPL